MIEKRVEYSRCLFRHIINTVGLALCPVFRKNLTLHWCMCTCSVTGNHHKSLEPLFNSCVKALEAQVKLKSVFSDK